VTRDSTPGTGPSNPVEAERSVGVHPLIALSVLNHVAFSGARVCLTLSALHLQASTFVVGALLALLGVLPMLLAVAGGRWVDRIGARLPMILGTGLVIAGTLAPAAWFSMPMLALACMVIGVGYLPFHLAIQKLISQAGPIERRRHNLSLMAIGFSVSAFLGPTITGFLIDGIGHRAAFGVLALLPIISIIWMRWMGARLQHRPLASAPSPSPTARLRDLLSTPELRRLYMVVALISSAWEVHQFLVPLYGASKGLSASTIGLILGAYAIASLVVRVITPIFLMNVREWTVISASLIVAVAVYVAYPFFDQLEALFILSFVLGLGLGVSQPMTMSILARVAPPERLGEATGLRLTLVFGTQTALPLAFGALGGVFGVGILFWGMAMLVAGGLMGVLRANRGTPPT
jgi:MFS family permease